MQRRGGLDTKGTTMTDDGVSDPPSNCSMCGTDADDPVAVLTWTLDVTDQGWQWICPDCARDHLRDIESRLGQEWW